MNKKYKEAPQNKQQEMPQTQENRQPTETQVEKEPVTEELQKEVERLSEEAAHWKDVAMRTQADMENLRKRTQIDIDKSVRYANGAFAKDLLPVADCLASALACRQNDPSQPCDTFLKNLLQGVEMTQKQLETALKKNGIEKMHTTDQVFDPEFHKVIQEVENPDLPEGTIVQELQTGYTIGKDRVLREAMVIVSKK